VDRRLTAWLIDWVVGCLVTVVVILIVTLAVYGVLRGTMAFAIAGVLGLAITVRLVWWLATGRTRPQSIGQRLLR
jgi:hypothetical protein